MNDYTFFFVGGTCGSFVKLIFAYYLTLSSQSKPVTLFVDPATGDCHNNYISHTHWLDQVDITKKIIVIDFDEDDKISIIKMAFWKVWIKNISSDSDILKKLWDGILSHVDPANAVLLEQTFIQNSSYLIFSDWQDQIKTLSPALIIKFKDIISGNLNKIIADFLQAPQLTEVDTFINEYRNINKKYIDKAGQTV